MALNKKNYHNLADDENITVLDYKASFKSNKEVDLLDEQGKVVDTLTADDIVISTGATPVIPDIKGIKESKHLYDSTVIMNLSEQPKRLVIVGGGYISLEFASTFSNFGTQVTVIRKANDKLMPREDEEIVSHAIKDLEDKGVKFELGAQTSEFEE